MKMSQCFITVNLYTLVDQKQKVMFPEWVSIPNPKCKMFTFIEEHKNDQMFTCENL